eukprot:gene16111-20588_t
MKKQYDAKALLDRIGDVSMPSLLAQLANANGCSKTKNTFNDRCQLRYSDRMPVETTPSRPYRLAVRSQPDDRKKSRSPIYRSGMTSLSIASAAAGMVMLIATH